jgi:choline dehydrogenase-like flavoprotein
MNYLTYLRGSRHDYDEWEQMGCKGWSYKDVLPYFIHCEKNTNADYVKSGKCYVNNYYEMCYVGGAFIGS